MVTSPDGTKKRAGVWELTPKGQTPPMICIQQGVHTGFSNNSCPGNFVNDNSKWNALGVYKQRAISKAMCLGYANVTRGAPTGKAKIPKLYTLPHN